MHVDGRRQARVPARIEALPVEDHGIELRASSYAPWTRTASIEGGTRRLNAISRA
ncbi:MAG: hypothetical protein JW751_05695 [Polyangiaceae bacterium]|nr:hypothetical protein [Polyangiaceae bacterium]